jgi:outer membrane protein, heavy metal efflux system
MRMFVLAIATVLAAAGRGVAEPPPLDSLVEEALAANPDVRAAAAAAGAARQRPAQASTLADPVLGVTFTNEGWSPTLGEMPDSSLGFMVSQDLPWPGKRRLRGGIAEQEALQAAQQLARARLGVEAAVRRAFHGLVQARGLLVLAGEQAEVLRQIEGVARARYGVGQGNQQDVLRAQVELTRVGQLLAEQEAEEAVRVAELNRLLGREGGLVETPSAPPPTASAGGLEQELERLRSRSPELAAARIAVDRARLVLDLARKEYRPDVGVQAGYMNRGGLDPMWQAAVSVTLPLRRKRRAGAVSEAEQLLRGAESRVAATEQQLRFRTRERLAQLEAAAKTAVLYEDGIVPQGRMSVEAALASYQSGRVPFLAVLEAMATLYGDRATLLRVQAGQGRIRAGLEEASLEATFDPGSLAPPSAGVPAAGGMAMGAGVTGGMGPMGR